MSTINITGTAMGLGAVSLSAIVLAACSSGGYSKPSTGGTAPSLGAGATSGLMTQSTAIGTVTTNSSGHTLYELVGDTAASPKCTGSCLSVWPAVMMNGTHVMLQGHPAYTFVGDTAAGQVKGQGLKDQWGTWYALDNTGKPITASAPTTTPTSAPTSSSGGYSY